MMEQILASAIGFIITILVIPVISILSKKLINFLNNKLNEYPELSNSTDAVIDLAKEIIKIYEDEVKNGKCEVDKEKILQKIKDSIIETIDKETIEYINNTFGNIDTWMSFNIEPLIKNIE